MTAISFGLIPDLISCLTWIHTKPTSPSFALDISSLVLSSNMSQPDVSMRTKALPKSLIFEHYFIAFFILNFYWYSRLQ